DGAGRRPLPGDFARGSGHRRHGEHERRRLRPGFAGSFQRRADGRDGLAAADAARLCRQRPGRPGRRPADGDRQRPEALIVTMGLAMTVLMLAAAEGACLPALEAIPAGAYPLKEGLAAGPCGAARPEVALRFEPASRFVRATRMIEQGDVVAAVPPAYLADVRPGQKVRLSA